MEVGVGVICMISIKFSKGVNEGVGIIVGDDIIVDSAVGVSFDMNKLF